MKLIEADALKEMLDKIPARRIENADGRAYVLIRLSTVFEIIKQLPSAQPDLDEWCTDCKEYDHEKHCCPRWNRVIRQTLKDAQQERKTGKWIADNRPGGGFWACSCCKFPSEAFAANVLYKFCPNCGADMRGDKS